MHAFNLLLSIHKGPLWGTITISYRKSLISNTCSTKPIKRFALCSFLHLTCCVLSKKWLGWTFHIRRANHRPMLSTKNRFISSFSKVWIWNFKRSNLIELPILSTILQLTTFLSTTKFWIKILNLFRLENKTDLLEHASVRACIKTTFCNFARPLS